MGSKVRQQRGARALVSRGDLTIIPSAKHITLQSISSLLHGKAFDVAEGCHRCKEPYVEAAFATGTPLLAGEVAAYAEVLAERDERERQERQKKEQEIFKRQAQNRAEARRKRLEQEALENDEDFD